MSIKDFLMSPMFDRKCNCTLNITYSFHFIASHYIYNLAVLHLKSYWTVRWGKSPVYPVLGFLGHHNIISFTHIRSRSNETPYTVQRKTDFQQQKQKSIIYNNTLTWYIYHHLLAPPVAYVSSQSAVIHQQTRAVSDALPKGCITYSAALNIV